MEIRQLEYFQMVSRLHSITKAARHLHVSQPSVTVSIQKLEEELGITLFDRNQKQFTLTAEGQIYLQRVDDILTRLHDSILEMKDYRTLQQGSIRIGITPTVGAALFPYIFTKFQQAYPHVKMTVIEQGSLAVRNQLENGNLDVGILILSNMPPRLETACIMTGQILVCLPTNHSLEKQSTISFSKLSKERFILFKEDTYSRQLILEQCLKHQFTPQIIFSSSQIETILGLVEQGAGISFLLDTIVEKKLNILSRPLTDPLLIRAGIAWNNERYLSNASKAFIDFTTTFTKNK
jgi:DNA-binding transcriptional LysR family regulator